MSITMDEAHVEEVKEHPDFHPCMTPRGLLWYDLSVLTAFQQKQLNEKKFDTIKEDLKYLAAHPEIRAIISIFVREVFRKLPLTTTIARFAANFFSSGKEYLQYLINKYMKEKGEPIKRQGDSAVGINIERRTFQPGDDYFEQNLYYYLSYTEKSSVREEEIETEWRSAETDSYSSYTASTSLEAATKYQEFDKKYSRILSSHSSGSDPTLLRVTPVGTTYDADDLDDDNDSLHDVAEATIQLTKQAIADADDSP